MAGAEVCDVSKEADVAAADRSRRRAVRPAGHHVQQRRHPDAPTRLQLEDHTVDDFERLTAVNFRGVFLGCKHAVIQFKKQGGGGVILNTGSVAGLVGWGGAVYGATKGAVHQLTRAVAIEGAPFGIRANAICPAGMPYTGFMAAGGHGALAARQQSRSAQQVGASASARPADHGRGLRRGRGLPGLRSGDEHHRRPAPARRRVRREMTDHAMLDIDRVRELFDLRGATWPRLGGGYEDDPYPIWHALREQAPVHAGIVHELTGFAGPACFHGLPYPDRPHFSAFSYAACDGVYRDDEVFASSPEPVDLAGGGLRSAQQHAVDGRNRSTAGTGPWCSRRSCRPKPSGGSRTGSTGPSTCSIDSFAGRRPGRAQRRLLRRHPRPDHHRQLRGPGRAGTRHPRGARAGPAEVVEILKPIVAARRESPQDDLISMLVEAEIKTRTEPTHRLSDAEIYSFALLLLAAGSGTTWKQMGITLTALLQRPEVLQAVTEDRRLLRVRPSRSRCAGCPTDPMFSRWVTKDIDFHGAHLPKASVLHICLGAANRDPARWDGPDEYDITPAVEAVLRLRRRAPCLSRHARGPGRDDRGHRRPARPAAEPPPRPRRANRPDIIGFYERGATAIPVVFG